MAKLDKNGYIIQLAKNEIFVFGSNGYGNHGAGAAFTAVDKFGAIMGQAEGLQGQSYAIDTMDGEKEMRAEIKRFLEFAEKHPELTFYVTDIGCGIAGYTPQQVAPNFKKHSENVILSDAFHKVLTETDEQFTDYLGKDITIKIDRPMGSKHPEHGFIYPVNYGFVPDTKSGDGEELDAYLLGVYEPVEEYTGKCIAVITRDDDNDDKLVIVPDGKSFNKSQIEALTEFQERFFKSHIKMA